MMKVAKKKDGLLGMGLRSLGYLLIASAIVACGDGKNPMVSTGDEMVGPAAKKGGAASATRSGDGADSDGSSSETAYSSDAGNGAFAGYNETNCPDYGIAEYTLWAGKTNDAGSVSITNDDENVYVTYNTNGTADLKEVHVYIWDDLSQIPDKRPAPGQAAHKAEDIYADSHTIVIPQTNACGETYYIATHAALVGDATDGDDADDGTGTSNDGETAYAGGSNTPGGFENGKGAWWGYVTYSVDCYFDLAGTVYLDADDSGDLESGENGFAGIEVVLKDANENIVATTTTDAHGDYLFEHLPRFGEYSVEVIDGPADHIANENVGGADIEPLDDCVEGVDFGYVPVYDISGSVYEDDDCDSSVTQEDVGLAGVTVTLYDGEGSEVSVATTDANGTYLFEDVRGGGDYGIQVETPVDYSASENSEGVVISGLDADLTHVNFGFCPPSGPVDPCEIDPQAPGCGGGGGGGGDFPTWAQAISHIILVFTVDSCPNCSGIDNDGYYTIKVDDWNDSAGRDLDNEVDAILAALEDEGLLVAGQYDLLGSSIKGGQQITSFYSYGTHNANGETADVPPPGIGITYNGTKDNEGNQPSIDEVIDRSALGLDTE